jgi:hypothetical protein
MQKLTKQCFLSLLDAQSIHHYLQIEVWAYIHWGLDLMAKTYLYMFEYYFHLIHSIHDKCY